MIMPSTARTVHAISAIVGINIGEDLRSLRRHVWKKY
jgi:hypothetical protein